MVTSLLFVMTEVMQLRFLVRAFAGKTDNVPDFIVRDLNDFEYELWRIVSRFHASLAKLRNGGGMATLSTLILLGETTSARGAKWDFILARIAVFAS
jgi:hypothetical protein